MTKNNLSNVDYWKSRQNQTWNSLEKDEAKLLKKLDKLYADQSADLIRDIAVYFGKYAKNDVIAYRDLLQSLDAADKKLLFERFDAFATKYPEYAYLLPIRESIYRLDRLEGLQYNIRLAQLELGASEQTALNKHLLDTYTGTYGRFAKELGLGMVDKQTAQLFINADWTGAGNYSSSIWSNRDKLAKYLANNVRNAFIRGDNYAKIAKAMEERFSKVSKADIRRLVYTEGTYVANMAMMAPFEESGLYDEYEYVAVIDGSTSDVCRGLDGQKYKIADKMPGVNFPPMHPRCRSTFLIVIPEEEEESSKSVEKANKSDIISYKEVTPEIEKALQKQSDKIWRTKLLGDEQNALREYTAQHFGIINRYLRDDLFLDDKDTMTVYDVPNAIKWIDRALNYGTLGYDAKLYRYTEYSEFFSLQQDGEFKNYLSTSVLPTATQNFGTGYKVINLFTTYFYFPPRFPTPPCPIPLLHAILYVIVLRQRRTI